MTESNDAESGPPGETTLQFLAGLIRDWGFALVVTLVIFFGYTLVFTPDAPTTGREVPDFTLTDLEGQETQLSSLDGQLVVLNFWFTSCQPCRAEIPELSAFAKAHPDVALYGVSTDTMPRERLKIASKRLGVEYPVLHDSHSHVARDYGIQVFPTTLVLRNREIVSARVGALRREDLESMVGHVH